MFKLNQIFKPYNISTEFRGREPVRTKIIINNQIKDQIVSILTIWGIITLAMRCKLQTLSEVNWRGTVAKFIVFYKQVMAVPELSCGTELSMIIRKQESKVRASETKFRRSG